MILRLFEKAYRKLSSMIWARQTSFGELAVQGSVKQTYTTGEPLGPPISQRVRGQHATWDDGTEEIILYLDELTENVETAEEFMASLMETHIHELCHWAMSREENDDLMWKDHSYQWRPVMNNVITASTDIDGWSHTNETNLRKMIAASDNLKMCEVNFGLGS